MPETLSNISGLGTPLVIAVAVTSSGDAVCFFRDSESLAFPRYKLRRRPKDNDWQPIARLLDPDWIGDSNDSLIVAYN